LRPKANLGPLKEFAREELPAHSTLQAIVLAEPDEMDAEIFLRKVPLWTRLLRKEKAAFEKSRPTRGERTSRPEPPSTDEAQGGHDE